MRNPHWFVFLLMLAVAASLPLGCGGGTSEGQPESSRAETESPSAGPAATPEPSSTEKPLEGLCTVLPPAEIEAAFGIRFTLKITGWADSNCQYAMLEHEAGQFIFQLRDRATYDTYKSSFEDEKYSFRYLEGIGQEAFILNHGQVEVLLDEDSGFSLAIILVTFGESPITKEEAEAAMEGLARKVADRL